MSLSAILIPPTLDAKQALRLRRFGLAALSYALTAAMVGAAWSFGALPAAAALDVAIAYFAINVGIYAAIRSGFNLRFGDPSLTRFQMLTAITVVMYIAYHMDHAREVALFGCFIVYFFGAFYLDTRGFTVITLYTLAAYAAVINLVMQFRPEAIHDVRSAWMSWLMLAGFLPCVSIVGGQINKLRRRLRESEARFRSLTEMSSDFYWESDAEHRLSVRSLSKSGAKSARGQRAQAGKRSWEIPYLSPDESGWDAHRAGLAARRPFRNFEFSRPGANGSERHFSVSGDPVFDEDGRFKGYRGVGTDMSARKRSEERLHLAASVFTYAREGIVITDAEGNIIEVNDAFSRITGYGREEVIGRNPRVLKSGRQDKNFYAAMWHDLIENAYWSGEIWNRRKNGEVYAEMLTISAVHDAQGNIRHYVALFSDITSLKEHELQLEHIAHYDALTMLPNRVLLADRLQQAMAQVQRRGQPLAVAYLDLDGFKAINDNHGHEAGDQLLVAIAARMKQVLREGDTLARLGGDEFVAVLLDLADIHGSEPILARLLQAAAQPVHTGDLALQVSVSLGISFYPQADDVDADQLLRQSDQAMYQAKLAGKNCYHVFDAEQDRSVRGRHESLDHIRQALTAREFVLHFQPKVNMRTGAVIGAEALIRWQHPERGLLAPAVFLPVIEDHPLAVEVGDWVIDSALTQIEIWRAAGLNIPVSVNVGARQLQQAAFVERLRLILAAHSGIGPGDLEIEVLETSALEDVARVSEVIEACREIGVTFALDDFGTGYSSLTYLKRLPVTLLKIDQSFVRDMLDDPDDLAILQGVLGLARAFRREVIAEGVETPEHGTLLLHLGCEQAQGYGIARPMPAGELPGWCSAWRTYPEWSNLRSVSQDDLPLLFAGVEHRAWVRAIEEYLKGERAIAPALDHHQCRLGLWLDAEGEARYGVHPSFKAMERLHRQVHLLVAGMCERHSLEGNRDPGTGLAELHGLRDALLKQLKALEKAVQP
jgi:diguanylate cyclase (GGDEF)-like protein/PAS domain S-box-containing protein